MEVYKIDPDNGERLSLLTRATVSDGGWVDLAAPIIVRAGEAFVAVPEPPAEQHGDLFQFRTQSETEVDKPG